MVVISNTRSPHRSETARTAPTAPAERKSAAQKAGLDEPHKRSSEAAQPSASSSFAPAKAANGKGTSMGPGVAQAKPNRDKMSLGKKVTPSQDKPSGDVDATSVAGSKQQAAQRVSVTDAARPTRTPTAEQRTEIQSAINGGHYQRAIDLTTRYYGINTSHVNGPIRYNPHLTSANAQTDSQRRIEIGPSAVQHVSEGRLAATITHEVTHANQTAAHGFPSNDQERAACQAMAFQAALRYHERFRLTPAQRQWHRTQIQQELNRLSPGNRQIYNDSGRYWDLE